MQRWNVWLVGLGICAGGSGLVAGCQADVVSDTGKDNNDENINASQPATTATLTVKNETYLELDPSSAKTNSASRCLLRPGPVAFQRPATAIKGGKLHVQLVAPDNAQPSPAEQTSSSSNGTTPAAVTPTAADALTPSTGSQVAPSPQDQSTPPEPSDSKYCTATDGWLDPEQFDKKEAKNLLPTYADTKAGFGTNETLVFPTDIVYQPPSYEAGQTFTAPRKNRPRHGAVDYTIPSGTNAQWKAHLTDYRVFAACAGTITESPTSPDEGRSDLGPLTIRCANKWMEFTYLHLSTRNECIYAPNGPFYAAKGSEVKAGKQVGCVGNTGADGIVHLHVQLAIKRAGKWESVDPEPYLNQNKQPKKSDVFTIGNPRGCFSLDCST